MPAPAFGPTVSASWVQRHLADPDLKVVDLRWYLSGDPGLKEYLKGHIPGAVFVEMSTITGRHGAGRHPLPSRAKFQSAMRLAGINRRDRVVVYDDASGSVAGRLWWLLWLFGHQAQAVLDGGIQAWPGRLQRTPIEPARGDFVAREANRSMYLTHDQVARHRGPLLDARAEERYRGEVEPIDAKAGHVPGAITMWWGRNVGPDGRFLSPARLRRNYESAGVKDARKAVAYCGSGITSTHDVIAMELAGMGRARLYPGSWSDWSRLPGAAVATGDGRSDPKRR